MSVSEEDADCPICCNELDLTDRSIQYCKCGFRPCLWCYHHILEEATKESLPARCPACRSEYDQGKISMQAIDAEQLEEEKRKLRERERPKGAGAAPPPVAPRVNRASLTNVRVVQPNLVYAVGIPMELCHEDTLRDAEFFGQFGKTVKISVNRSNQYASAMARHGPTGSAYVTFRRGEDALRCIKAVDGALWRGKPVKACFGTTKYCNAFIKGLVCNNPDCLYLHDLADEADCLTKEEVAAGLLPARFLAMGATNTFKPRLTINLIPNAATAAAQAAAAAAAAAGQPPAAITAAAAAAGGISRAAPGGGGLGGAAAAASGSGGPRVITIPAPTRGGAGGAQQQQQHDSNGHPAGGMSVSPPRAGSAAFTAAAAAAPMPSPPRGLWASAAAGSGPGPVPGSVAPAPPTDKQEWPSLAAPAGGAGGAAAADREDSARGDGGMGRAPSMAEQLARAHSNPAEALKARQQPKKLLPLASPAKLKPLGKAVQRPASPLDVHAAAKAAAARQQAPAPQPAAPPPHLPNGRGAAPAAQSSVGAIGQGIVELNLGGASGASNSGGVPKPAPAARGPPPGFGGAPLGAASHQQHHLAQQSVQQQQQQQQQQPARAPPPGFHGSASTAGAAPGGLPGGYSPFIGGSALFDPPTLGPSAAMGIPGASAGSGAGASRRQKSRFAFANEDDGSGAGAHGGAQPPGFYGGGGGGFGGGGPPAAAPLPTLQLGPSAGSPGVPHPAPTSPSLQDASAFFKSLFPGATVNVAAAPSPSPPQQQHRMAAPPGFGGGPDRSPSLPPPQHDGCGGGMGALFPPPTGMGGPPLVQPPGPNGPANAGAGLAPGLALLRQLQGGGGPGAPPQQPGAPPGYGGAPQQPPPGFGMRM